MNVSCGQAMNPILALRLFDQSIWLDSIERRLLNSGEFRRLVLDEGLCGVTSDHTTFAKAISGNMDYAEALAALRRKPGLDAKARYERLAIEDIQTAADLLQPVYARTKRRDGYVSLEISPHLARDLSGTLEEAQRLWDAVGRDNLMIKVPATPEGIPAIVQLLSKGININVTLIFSQETYARVAEAYLLGLEQLAARSGPVGSVASVASVCVSPLDTTADAAISAYLATSIQEAEWALFRSLRGKIAIANATLIYHKYRTRFSGPRWDALVQRGAMSQRVLWTGTGTKDPTYRDVKYVEGLIAPDTVNAMPPATFEAFRDHGRPGHQLSDDVEDAKAVLRAFAQTGVSLKKITDRLLEEELQVLKKAFDQLLVAVERQSRVNEPVQPKRPLNYSLRLVRDREETAACLFLGSAHTKPTTVATARGVSCRNE